MFESVFLQAANKVHLQITAPVGGSILGILAEQYTPIISLFSVILGIVLGILTFVLNLYVKMKEQKMRKEEHVFKMKQYSANGTPAPETSKA